VRGRRGARASYVAAPEFIESTGDENVVEGERGTDDDRKKENEAGHAKTAIRASLLLAPGPALGQLQLKEAQNLIWIFRFGLAVAVGIHRERILTIPAKHKWILRNPGQT